ncbi:hypothetical protein AAU61_08160 [Desulfocarbo indianensis]|nr:hypothetical protein AAU61_08160 [Desulfocarbo indianensis]
MPQPGQGMLDRSQPPGDEAVRQWIGRENYQRWQWLLRFIAANYPGAFPQDDRVLGGRKHGWGPRFKKSKFFCALLPEKGRLLLQIVPGGAEPAKAEAIMDTLSQPVRGECAAARTYHDGKWLAPALDNDEILGDAAKLSAIKRKPKPA